MVILGANGAGKTTTLRALSGMIDVQRPDRRSTGARSLGRRPEQIARAGIAHVPQGRGTITDLTVDENLRLGAYHRARSRRSTPTSSAGTTVFPRLGKRRDQLAGSMSGGEQQMLAIARALMARPKLRAARRAVARARADRHPGAVPHARRPQPRAGHLDARRRAEREPRARDRAARLRARDGLDRRVGIGRRARRQRRRPPARTWGSDAPCRSSSPSS